MRKYKYYNIATIADEYRAWLWTPVDPLANDYAYQYRRSRIVEKWDKPYPLYTYETTKYIFDKPDAVDTNIIVSDRARQLLEVEAPAAFQYLPVRVQGPGSSTLPNYWLLNWLQAVDCVVNDEYYAQLIGDVRVALVKGDEIMDVWRSDLVRKIKAAKLTGFSFFGMHIDYGEPPARRKKTSK